MSEKTELIKKLRELDNFKPEPTKTRPKCASCGVRKPSRA